MRVRNAYRLLPVAVILLSGRLFAGEPKRPPRRPTPDFKKAAEEKKKVETPKKRGNDAPTPPPPWRPVWKPPSI